MDARAHARARANVPAVSLLTPRSAPGQGGGPTAPLAGSGATQ